MEQVIMAIAAPLARTYGINKAIEIAYEQLGITPPQTDPIDIYRAQGSMKTINYLKHLRDYVNAEQENNK